MKSSKHGLSAVAVIAFAVSLSITATTTMAQDSGVIGNLRYNETQNLGSHNSYHQLTSETLLQVIEYFDETVNNPNGAKVISASKAWYYQHESVQKQIQEMNLNHFEFDFYYQDTTDGVPDYAKRKGELLFGVDNEATYPEGFEDFEKEQLEGRGKVE